MMNYGMGWGMGWGWHWLGMLLFWLLLLIVIVLAVVAVKSLFPGGARTGSALREERSRGLEVLEERYARGDINREEYLQKRDDLKRR